MANYDLLLKGGRLIDPAAGLDGKRDVAIAASHIAAVGEDLSASNADRVVDVSGKIVLPGLVDFHTHAYWGVCEYGVDPDTTFLPTGVTTVLDVGSAGVHTLPGLRRYVIEPSQTRIFALLHVNTIGMTHTVGELLTDQYVNPEVTAAVAKENSDIVVGIKVRLSRKVAGEADWQAFMAARKAADMASMPLMVHFGDSATPLSRVLAKMGQGDILTHCFSGRRNNIMGEDRRLLPAVWDAARRGVIFDVGHGMGSFNFDVAHAALEQGFVPTTISSDLHAFSLPHPAISLLTTMTKFVELGLPLADVVERATVVPARLLGQEGKIGTLQPGAEADVAVVRELEGEFRLWDADGNSRVARRFLSPFLTLRAGRPY